jgi:hypothetical protein
MPADAHVETQLVPGRRLGRRPHDPNRRTLQLGRYLTGVVPAHPAAANHFSEVVDWGLYENDQFGDCGPTSVANCRKLITRYLGGAEHSPSQADVFDLYRRSGNPTFDPATGVDDNGVDMKTMLQAVVSGGIGGVKALAFASVDVSNLDEVRAAVSIFGSLLLGVDLEVAQQTQTNNGLWDYQSSSQWGGHAVLTGAYTSSATGGDLSVVTWAEVVALTDSFWQHQVQEAYVVVWPEHLGATGFQQGVNLSSLAADYTALTGRPFPGGTPSPSPTPEPPAPAVDSADRALATAVRTWLSERHTGDNKKAATAVRTWLAVKGLS